MVKTHLLILKNIGTGNLQKGYNFEHSAGYDDYIRTNIYDDYLIDLETELGSCRCFIKSKAVGKTLIDNLEKQVQIPVNQRAALVFTYPWTYLPNNEVQRFVDDLNLLATDYEDSSMTSLMTTQLAQYQIDVVSQPDWIGLVLASSSVFDTHIWTRQKVQYWEGRLLENFKKLYADKIEGT
jgi:hypothetical protein